MKWSLLRNDCTIWENKIWYVLWSLWLVITEKSQTNDLIQQLINCHPDYVFSYVQNHVWCVNHEKIYEDSNFVCKSFQTFNYFLLHLMSKKILKQHAHKALRNHEYVLYWWFAEAQGFVTHWIYNVQSKSNFRHDWKPWVLPI